MYDDEAPSSRVRLKPMEEEIAGSRHDDPLLELMGENARLRSELARYRKLAIRDSLTGLYNRRYFDQRLLEEWTRARRLGAGLCLMIIDVDNFKTINDTLGHRAGDDVLRWIARSIEQVCREFDVICRLGGDEYAVILPGTERKEGRVVAARIRELLASGAERPKTIGERPVQFSYGCVSAASSSSSLELLVLSDDAMYRDKRTRQAA